MSEGVHSAEAQRAVWGAALGRCRMTLSRLLNKLKDSCTFCFVILSGQLACFHSLSLQQSVLLLCSLGPVALLEICLDNQGTLTRTLQREPRHNPCSQVPPSHWPKTRFQLVASARSSAAIGKTCIIVRSQVWEMRIQTYNFPAVRH